MTAIVNKLASPVKLEPTTARFKAVGVRAALSFPSDHHIPTSRFQCVFSFPQDALDCGKLLSPYLVDISHLPPTTAPSAKSRIAGTVNPAQSAISQAYSQHSGTRNSAQSQTPIVKKGGSQKGTKRKADMDSMESPAKRGKQAIAPRPTSISAESTAACQQPLATTPTTSTPEIPPPVDITQNDAMAAMKADLLRNFGQSNASSTPPIAKEEHPNSDNRSSSAADPRHSSSNTHPSATQHTDNTSTPPELDLLPRSPLINASSQSDRPIPDRTPPHMPDLLSLDPAGFVPDEEILLVNTTYPVMHTAQEERAEAIRVKAEEAELEEGEQDLSIHSWREWAVLSDEELYQLLCQGMVPESFLITAHRVLHLHTQVCNTRHDQLHPPTSTHSPFPQEQYRRQQDYANTPASEEQYTSYGLHLQSIDRASYDDATRPRTFSSYRLPTDRSDIQESYPQHQAFDHSNNDVSERPWDLQWATQGLGLIDDMDD